MAPDSKMFEGNLDRGARLARAGRVGKLARSPVLMIRTQALEEACRLLGRVVEKGATTFWGDEMTVIVPDSVSIGVWRYGFFEEGLTRFLLSRLREGMTFVDVGAHIGYFSLLASWLVGPRGEVHCFEPGMETFRILMRNVNNRRNVVANNLAVWSEATKLDFNDYGMGLAAFNTVFSGPRDTRVRPRKTARYSVLAVRLDDYIQSTGIAPALVKIDAENAELEVLRGLTTTMARLKPLISIEVGDARIEGTPASREVIEFAVQHGYRPYEIQGTEVVPHSLRESYRYDNLILAPE